MGKHFFKDGLGNFHFGLNSPEGFNNCKEEELLAALENLGEKKLWRCNVCDDLRIARDPLEICPTCFAKDAFVEISLKEFNQLIKLLQ